MKVLVTGASGFIGTNCMEFLSGEKIECINLDCRPPRNSKHKKYWRECNILDYPRLEKIVKDFEPTHVIHLAAKTGLDEKHLLDFAANMEGVENLLRVFSQTPSVKHAIFTSSLLVCKMGYVPTSDTDYKPTTLYGQSKVEGEKIVRAAKNLPFAWTIVRPISVWGPWQEEPYINLFKSVAHEWYFHIGPGHYRRSMGYVENMVYQFYKLLLAAPQETNQKTFYLGDNVPVDLYEFANEIQSTLGVKSIKHLPLGMIKAAAKMGDFLKISGWKRVPLTSFRLNNIRTEYVFDLSPVIKISGLLPYDFKTGIKRTIQHMQRAGEIKAFKK